MEWQGIDLSFSRQSYWIKETKQNLIKVLTGAIIAILLSVLMMFFYKNHQDIYQLNVAQYQEEQNKIALIESQISHLIKTAKKDELHIIDHKVIDTILLYIEQFQVSGAIESIQLYKNEKVFCKIIGKLHHQSEFQRVEKQLKESHLDYQVEQYHTNDKQQIEFTLLIKLGE